MPVVLHAVVTNSPPPRPVVPVDPFVLWIGALVTTLVGGLVSIVGILAARSLPEVDLITPGGYVAVIAWHLTAGTVVAVLAGALLLHLLLLLSPRPLLFFRWVTLLVTAMVALWPFTTDVTTRSKCVSALVYLAIGLSVTSLLMAVCRQCWQGAVRRPDR